MFNYGALWTPKSHRILTVYTTNISSIFISLKQKILKVTQVELKMNWLMKKDVILQLQMKNVATWARSKKSEKLITNRKYKFTSTDGWHQWPCITQWSQDVQIHVHSVQNMFLNGIFTAKTIAFFILRRQYIHNLRLFFHPWHC